MSGEITARAPGKLFIAGEYAVVTPGEPAVLVAVDRYLTVSVTESTQSGSIHSPEFGRTPLRWVHGTDGLSIDTEHHPYDYVLSAITVVEELRRARGLPPRLFDLRVDSGLDDVSGRKFGLGSSAAVTVATVRALDELHGLALGRREQFAVSLLATIRVSPRASGGDLAASTFGGWIGYRSPDRATIRRIDETQGAVAALQSDGWSSLEIVRLPPPEDLRFLVGWTGVPASTERLVRALGTGPSTGGVDQSAFLLDSRRCVTDLWSSLTEGDDDATLQSVHRARRLLQRLGTQASIEIETPRLAALCDVAERHGAAAKPSGAGGGDCGIALAPPEADVPGILRAWESHDIRHLTVSVHPAEGGTGVL